MRVFTAAAVAALAFATPATAQDIKIHGAVELSGAGAVSGTNFRDGIVLAVEEINAKGGILGRKVVFEGLDTQSNPTTARAVIQRILDEKPYVLFGPVFSGSVMVTMEIAQGAGIRRSPAAKPRPSRRRAIPSSSARRSASRARCRRSRTMSATN